MKYIATKEIGGYQIGDEVPSEKAEVWMNMYLESPVEKIEEDTVPENKKISGPESFDVMLDDYLNRSANSVKKAIEEDILDKEQLEKLLKLELSDKKRDKIINAIKIKLEKS